MSPKPAEKPKRTPGTLAASTRTGHGKGVARQLRREGKVPAVIYGKAGSPVSISLTLKDVSLEYARGRFRSRVVDITVDGKAVKALPKDVQFHPVTDVIEHVDFMKVETGVPVHVMVPVHVTNQDKSPGLKRGGVLNIVRHEIEFICTPEAIPTHIDVNVEGLEIGSSVHINSITLPKGVTPAIKRNFTVATIAGRKAEEEEVKPVVATAEGAVPGAEGAAAAPGAPGAPGAAPAAGAPAAGAAAPAAGGKDAGKKEEKKK